MNRRSPLAQLAVFVGVLILINLVFYVLDINMRISIIGSIVLTLVVGGAMGAMNRR